VHELFERRDKIIERLVRTCQFGDVTISSHVKGWLCIEMCMTVMTSGCTHTMSGAPGRVAGCRSPKFDQVSKKIAKSSQYGGPKK